MKALTTIIRDLSVTRVKILPLFLQTNHNDTDNNNDGHVSGIDILITTIKLSETKIIHI